MAWLDAIGSSTNDILGLGLLMASAMLEYVFPPFPGDMLTVFGGVLISAYHWNPLLLFALVTTGSVLGGLFAFYLGRRWHQRRAPELAKDDTRLAKLVLQFKRRGSIYLLVNRFLPGIRPLFFVAAGLSGMSTRRVVALSALSASVYNALLLTAGIALGKNLGLIQQWLTRYSIAVWILIIAAAVVLLLKKLLRAKPGLRPEDQAASDE